MESSRRAVEAYRRTRLIDGVTTDDDKIAPVYKFDEISAVLQSSSHDIVHEIVEYILKRLEHKSPIVKQKTLRVIKFVVGKSGPEFKREIQRQSGAIRQLFHYRGQPDPLKGDSLNKAVRDTAHEAINAMFTSEDKSMDDTSKRIQGFGSTNFDARPQEKKTLLSEVVDLGTASIKQGLSMISNHYGHFSNNNMKSNISGSYEAPNLRRSVSDRDTFRDSYRESRDTYRDSYSGRDTYAEPSRLSYEAKTTVSTTQPHSPKFDAEDETEDGGDTTQEEKLLDSATSLGGVRLQPSRDNIQSFLLEAQKLNPDRLCYAFEQKLQVHSWQVRLKTLCFLEAILRQGDVTQFGEISRLFEENSACVVDCTESPQASLRDKAKKVLNMLRATPSDQSPHRPEEARRATSQARKAAPIEMPDLIDTADLSLDLQSNEVDVISSSGQADPLVADSFTENVREDPFAGMAIHTSQTSSNESLLDVNQRSENGNGSSSLFEGLSVIEEQASPAAGSLADLLGGLSTNDKTTVPQTRSERQPFNLESALRQPSNATSHVDSKLNGWAASPSEFVQPTIFPSSQQQMMYINPMLISSGALQPGMLLQQAFAQGYPGVNAAFAQQQHAAGFGMGIPLAPQGSFGTTGGLDGFDFSGNPIPVAVDNSKKEDTKAFDFISDHVTAARTVKK